MAVSCSNLNDNERQQAILLTPVKQGSESRGTMLLIHGSAPFNIEGQVPLVIDSVYAKKPFYLEFAHQLNENGINVLRYSKPGVTSRNVNFEIYKNTDLKILVDQLKEVMKQLPVDHPRILFAWSEGSLHLSQLPLDQIDAVILLGAISTNIRDVILSQASGDDERKLMESDLNNLFSMKRDEMLGNDRPVGRLLDEFRLDDNWKYFAPFKKLPILILHGSEDKEVPLSQVHIWKSKLPAHNITVIVRPNGNHMLGIGNDFDTAYMTTAITKWLDVALGNPHARMQIHCTTVSIGNPLSLNETSLPHQNLKMTVKDTPPQNFELFKNLIEQFNQEGDKLVSEIFAPLLPGKKFEMNVIATQGIPDPYDAWSADYQGEKAFFFNLDLWENKDLEESGLDVIKHEITHVLLDSLLQKPDEHKSADVLNHILINEGIAHFIGHPRKHALLSNEYASKWQEAEKQLEIALRKLSSPETSINERENLIVRANTGRFWDKYASIAGMFRVADLYNKQGAKGIMRVILENELPYAHK